MYPYPHFGPRCPRRRVEPPFVIKKEKRRPGHLGDWDEDLKNYMKAKYPGWQSQELNLLLPEPRGGVYSSPYFPFGPTSPHLLHIKHGLIPEADVISSRMPISTPSYEQAY